MKNCCAFFLRNFYLSKKFSYISHKKSVELSSVFTYIYFKDLDKFSKNVLVHEKTLYYIDSGPGD